MNRTAPRLVTGAGSQIPRLGTQRWGSYTLPQSGTLPVGRPRASSGLAGLDDGTGDEPGAATRGRMTFEVVAAPLEEDAFPWGLIGLAALVWWWAGSSERRSRKRRTG